MGLLDDAIRDHLELKRRRGADPSEVERAEREALGPVRRQPEPAGEELDYAEEPVAPREAIGAEDEGLPYDEKSLDYEEELDEEAGWHDAAPGVAARDPASEPSPRSPRWTADDEPFDEPDQGVDTKPHEAVRPDPGAPPPRRAGRIGEETAEYDVEGEKVADERGEDVLEETPEFLQDTPDHDRLWFEQRPPRDFNFDG